MIVSEEPQPGGSVVGQSFAGGVQLAQRGETHTYFILAHGKS